MNEVSMDKIVVYFHGYGSKPEGDKLDRLSALKNTEAFAFPIDIDPDIAFKSLEDSIDSLLVDNYRDEVKLIFVGTSLGAWYASKLANRYGCDAVLINPCYDPVNMLKKHGVDTEKFKKYGAMGFLRKFKYFIAVHDEVIDFSTVKDDLKGCNVTWDSHEAHRFNGKGFDNVCEYIARM